MNLAAGIQPETLTALIALVREHTGIAMSERKSILLERRLRPRMQALEIGSYQDYLDKVVRDRAEVPHFIDLVTTNDTLFFRTQQVWDYVEQEFLPQWQRDHAGQTLKIWSAAASSGEELYSMAILCEEFKARTPGFTYQIYATDISQQILAQARAGRYAGRSVEKIRTSHPDWVKKYFQASSHGLQVVEALKKKRGVGPTQPAHSTEASKTVRSRVPAQCPDLFRPGTPGDRPAASPPQHGAPCPVNPG